VNSVQKEELVARLALVIDSDRPPGLAARTLARSVISLVRDRGGKEAAVLAEELDRFAVSFPRVRRCR
jgi:hypothetical protein